MIATKKTMTVLLVLVFEMTKGNSNKNIFYHRCAQKTVPCALQD